jgi:hypothetical protein
MAAHAEELFEVQILGFPVPLYARARRHMEALTREFEFIAEGAGDDQDVPRRLLDLVERIRPRFAGLNTVAEARIEAALASGEETVDLVYQMPLTAAAASEELIAMLEEADEFCRQGELLTLAAAPEESAFRRWFLHEFATQLHGGGATRWSG